MLGYPLEFWESVFFWATGVAAFAGAISVTAAFLAGIVGYQVTDRLVKESDRKISEANARGEEAKADAARVLERVANAEAREAEAELKLAELKKRQEPRGGAMGLEETLRDAPPGKVKILYQQGRPESAGFASVIRRQFIEGRWQILEFKSVAAIDEKGAGTNDITLLMRSLENKPESIQAAERGLEAAGFRLDRTRDSTLPSDVLLLVISPKP